MKHGCVILADVHHQMLEDIRGLLDTKFQTVVMVSSYESLLRPQSRSGQSSLWQISRYHLPMAVSC